MLSGRKLPEQFSGLFCTQNKFIQPAKCRFFRIWSIMPTFSKTSEDRLAQCHPDLQKIFNRVIEYVDCSIFCGNRGESDQNAAVRAGLSKATWPTSKHNKTPSLAVDAGPYFIDLRNTDWEDGKAFAKFAGFVQLIAIQLRQNGEISHYVRWGGDWDGDGRTNDETFSDLPHFELIP